MDWVKIWTFFFFLSLGIFTALALTVTIGGFFNIRSLFKDLSDAKAQAQTDSKNDSHPGV
jgi:Skp family chaperone for outer membrane proteins